MNARALNRSVYTARPLAPIRIVHLGLGAFHRAHQAWYTQKADPAGEWGIASFTGRRPDAATALAAQDGLYTLITRSSEGDGFEVQSSIVEANDGANVARLCELLELPATAVVTLTITEAAYHLGADGMVDLGQSEVAADLAILRASAQGGSGQYGSDQRGAARHSVGGNGWTRTPAGRLVQALDARRRAGSGGIAIVSCDNLATNGEAARAAICGLAAAADVELADWISRHASFVSSSVDRITPRTTEAEVALVAAATGFRDTCPVVAEPFRDWVLSGSFPAGRPAWEDAGAVFVDDIEPYENRKLWLLNGAHSLLAYAGSLRGHSTVAQALADPVCAAWVEEFWDEAEANLPAAGLDIPAYRQALRQRFANGRIAHHLAQIALDGSAKLRMRAVPVLAAERRAHRSGDGAAKVVAAWVAFLRRAHRTGAAIGDAEASAIAAALDLGRGPDLPALLALLDPALVGDGCVVEAQVAAQLSVLADAQPTPI